MAPSRGGGGRLPLCLVWEIGWIVNPATSRADASAGMFHAFVHWLPQAPDVSAVCVECSSWACAQRAAGQGRRRWCNHGKSAFTVAFSTDSAMRSYSLRRTLSEVYLDTARFIEVNAKARACRCSPVVALAGEATAAD